MSSVASWLVKLNQSPVGSPTLLVCPHAGGGPMLYRTLAEALNSKVAVWAINYPGRERQTRLPLPDSLRTLADAIIEQIPRRLAEPVVLFGHSMGAVVAQEIALRLPDRVGGVVVSAHVSPLEQAVERELHLSSDERLLDVVETLGAVPPGLLRHTEFGDYLLPVLRNDLRIVETHPYSTELLCVPLVAYAGAEDAVALPERMKSWADLTNSRFRRRVFPGGHFYFLTETVWVARQLHRDVLWCLGQ